MYYQVGILNVKNIHSPQVIIAEGNKDVRNFFIKRKYIQYIHVLKVKFYINLFLVDIMRWD